MRHAAGGAVRYDRPLPLPQDVIDANRQGIFFADVAAGFIDDGQTIGIGILAKANVGPSGLDLAGHRQQVFRGRLGGMLELAVRIPTQ